MTNEMQEAIMQQDYKCPKCNQVILYEVNPCTHCKCLLAWSQQGPIIYIPPSGATQQIEDKIIDSQINSMRGGASWFFWIAGLSIINSIILMIGGNWGFFVGLGIPYLISGPTVLGNWTLLLSSILIAGILIVCGVFAYRGKAWGFIAGLILYLIDGLIFVVAALSNPMSWLFVGFHVLAMIFIGFGLRANIKLKKLQKG